MNTFPAAGTGSAGADGWGPFEPGERVNSVAELRAGDLVLEHARKPGFYRPCRHVIEILGGDPSGANRPLVRGRIVEAGDAAALCQRVPGCVVLWDFYLAEGRTTLFRAVRR